MGFNSAVKGLISLLYFRTSYVKLYSEWRNEVSFDHLTTVHWIAENVRYNIKGSKSVRGEFEEKSEEVVEVDSEILYWITCLGAEQYEAKKRFFTYIVRVTFSSTKYSVVERKETIWMQWVYLHMLSLSPNNIQMRFGYKETTVSLTATLRFFNHFGHFKIMNSLSYLFCYR
jgi:hypothetical protein